MKQNTLVDNARKAKIYKLMGRFADSTWFSLQTEDSSNSRLTHFDDNLGIDRSIRYAANMNTPYVDEQDESKSTLMRKPIIFEKGILAAKAEEQTLQRFLDIHPGNAKNGGAKFFEYNPEKEASVELDMIEMEHEALGIALNIDIDKQEAVMRPRLGQSIYTLTPKEVKRATISYAKENPKQFLMDVNNDRLENIALAYKAIDLKLLKLTDGKSILRWGDGNEQLTTIKLGQEPFEYIAKWFETDDGKEVLSAIMQKLAPKTKETPKKKSE